MKIVKKAVKKSVQKRKKADTKAKDKRLAQKWNMPKLGNLERVKLEEVWRKNKGERSEDAYFSSWVADEQGRALLGEVLGTELELEGMQMEVGKFRADVVFRDGNDRFVVVENQFGKSDHEHLGKLLTYSAGLEGMDAVRSVVWIVGEKFEDEHRAALDWLNKHTSQDIGFFGLELEMWKIQDSRNPLPAPKFNVVSRPNMLIREVQARNVTWPQAEEYWEEFKIILNRSGKVQRKAHTRLKDAYMSIQQDGMLMYVVVARTKKEIRADLIVDDSVFEALRKYEKDINREVEKKAMGGKLKWEPPSGKRNKGYIRIVKQECDVGDKNKWSEQHEWLKNQLELLYRIFCPRIRALGAEMEDESGE